LEEYNAFLEHPELRTSPEVVESLFEKVYQDSKLQDHEKAELHNTVLSKLLPYDSSLSSIHLRSLNNLGYQMSADALEQVILHNKGRVDSSWEIFSRWLTSMEGVEKLELQPVLKKVLEKVVHGDPSEQEDGYQMNGESLGRAVWILKNLEQCDNEIHELVLQECLKAGEWSLVNVLGVHTLGDIAQLKPNDEQLLMMWSMLKDHAVSETDVVEYSSTLERLLIILSKMVSYEAPSTNETIKSLSNRFPALSVETQAACLSTIEELMNLLTSFLDSSIPCLKLRQTMLKCQGIYLSNFSKSLELYHQYIVCDKSNVDLYMTTMVQIACYHAVLQDSMMYLTIAESLIPQPIPVKCLQAQILTKSVFKVDDSLGIYNEYIGKVSKENNKSGYSQSGLLCESLILAFLTNEQREFAYVIRDGAIGNGLIAGETAQGRLKPYFRRYGEILGDEDSSADHKELFKREILAALESL
jgi:hypothetical protein